MAHVLAPLRIVPKTQCAEAASLAQELGMTLQARRFEKPLAENVFIALTADEVTLWMHHCPTRYFQPPVAKGNKSIEDYAFDSVPIEVMRHWKAIKDNYAFDRYEIWTTERTQHDDPLLIGFIGQRLYLLARWGLESPEQLPLKKIAQDVYEWGRQEAAGWGADYPFQALEKKIASNLKRISGHYSRVGAAARYLGIE